MKRTTLMILTAFAVLLATGTISFGSAVLWDFNEQLAHRLPEFLLFDGKLYLPWQMIAYLSAGFICMIALSLFTKPVAASRLDRLYACLRTPVQLGEPETEFKAAYPDLIELVDQDDAETVGNNKPDA